MKPLHFPAILILFLVGQAVIAQKNSILLDGRYAKHDGLAWVGGTLGYYRQVGKRQEFGIKVAFDNYSLKCSSFKGTACLNPQIWLAMLDITNRWKLSKKKKSNWYAEVGVSGFLNIRRNPPFTPEIDYPVSPAVYQRLIEEASKYHTQSWFYTGFASAIHWEYAITSKFAIGINCLTNLYLGKKYDDLFVLQLLPSLHSAYRF